MEVSNRISTAIIIAVTNLLLPYCPDINPRNLIKALKDFEPNKRKEMEQRFEKPLTRNEVAELLGVSMPTVNRMMNDGRLQKIKLSPNGTTRITPESVRHFIANGYQQPFDAASFEG